MTNPRQPNLFRELKRALEESLTLNPNQQGGEYQYWLDIGVILRCLVEDHTDEEILASLDSHGYKASASLAPFAPETNCRLNGILNRKLHSTNRSFAIQKTFPGKEVAGPERQTGLKIPRPHPLFPRPSVSNPPR